MIGRRTTAEREAYQQGANGMAKLAVSCARDIVEDEVLVQLETVLQVTLLAMNKAMERA